MANPSLPQNDTPAEREARAAQIAAAKVTYALNTSTTVSPLAMVAAVPKADRPTLVWIDAAAAKAIELLGNLLVKLSLLEDGGLLQALSTTLPEHLSIRSAVREITAIHRDLTATLQRRPRPGPPAQRLGLLGAAARIVDGVEDAVEGLLRGESEAGGYASDVFDAFERIAKLLLSDAFQALERYLGLYGTATSMNAFEELFQNVRLPSIASNYETDTIFGWMRVGGPNPMVLRRWAAPDARFPFTDAHYVAALSAQSAFVSGDGLDRAMAEGRVYVADYSAFDGVPTGTVDGMPKYLATGYALFAVPLGGRRLLPVAIQLGASPGNSNPITTPVPADGTRDERVRWELARLQIQTADGCVHEAVSHLGQTHLVVEVFVLAMHRTLAPEHPLYVLLAPHVEGTLFINNAAVSSLINTGGVVDKIMSPTIDASRSFAVHSVLGYNFNERWAPRELAARGVADRDALPEYPYRDDALLLWDTLRAWVHDYLAVYYDTPADIAGDDELQAWAAEVLASGLSGFGEDGAIRTFGYLVNAVTHVIFTGSVQHAAVNFQQSLIMSFAPAMPLAAYIPPNAGATPKDTLAQLPPLQNAVLQQAVGLVLGGVYHTRLGDYDRYSAKPTFTDPRVQGARERLVEALRTAERVIGQRNLERIPYTLLLPSAIPQSINI